MTDIELQKQLVITDIHIDCETGPAGVSAWVTVEVENRLSSACTASCTVVVARDDISEKMEVTADIGESGGVFEAVCRIEDPELWQPGDTNACIYECMAGVRTEEGVQDAATTRFGLRDVRLWDLSDENGSRWQLEVNGKKCFVAAATLDGPSLSREEIRLCNQMNLNALIVSDVHSDEFYSSCDEYGIMVFQDVSRVDGDLAGTIKSLRNHPSIVFWTGINVENAETVKSLDHSRLSCGSLPVCDCKRDNFDYTSLLRAAQNEWRCGQTECGCPIVHIEVDTMSHSWKQLAEGLLNMAETEEQEDYHAGVYHSELLFEAIMQSRVRTNQVSGVVLGGVKNLLAGGPAFYGVKRALAPVVVFNTLMDDVMHVYIVNDSGYDMDGVLKTAFYTFDVPDSEFEEVRVHAESGSCRSYYTIENALELFDSPHEQCLTAQLHVGDMIASSHTFFLAPFSEIDFPSPRLLVNKSFADDNDMRLNLAADGYARTVYIQGIGKDAVVADSFFDLFPAEAKTVAIRNVTEEEAARITISLIK